MSTLKYLCYCGTMGGLASLAALAAMAGSRGDSPLRPINATSHWLHGDEAADVGHADLSHTATALLTHAASAAFWALPFARWLSTQGPRSPLKVFGEASVLSAFAYVFDYGVVPRRLSPGWELALPRGGVALAFAALAGGLAIGGLAAQRSKGRAW